MTLNFSKPWKDLNEDERTRFGGTERQYIQQQNALKNVQSQTVSTDNSLIDGQTKLTGILNKNLGKWSDLGKSIMGASEAQSTFNSVSAIAEAALEREQKIRTEIVQELGQVGALQQMQNENMFQASIEAERYGVSLDEMLTTMTSLAQAMGRNVLISDEDLARVAIFQKSLGLASSEAANIAKYFDQMGFSIGEAIDKGNEMATVARQMGINVGDFMSTISSNMDMLNTYNFADGVRGFAKMAAQAQKLGISMSTTAALAEKVMDPEGAIELAANLQVIGGAVGDLADPFKLMYQATNDLGGLQDSLVQAGQELAMFNEETGEISFPPTAQRQLRAMAETLGISKEEFASMIKLQTKFTAMQNQFSFELEGREDMQEFVTSMASLNQQTGKYEIKVPGLEQAVEIEDLTANQLDALKEVQAQQQMTEKELMAEQTGLLQSIDNNTKALDTALLAGVVEGLDLSRVQTELSQAVSKAFSSDELGKISDSLADVLSSGMENVIGTEMSSIMDMVGEGGNIVQALLGTTAGGMTDLMELMTQASQKDFIVQQGNFNIGEVTGTNANDFELGPGNAQAILTSNSGVIIPSANDTVAGVDFSAAGAKGANLGSLVSNTQTVPQQMMKVEFTGLPSRIPIELNGTNMGDFNWRGLIGNPLFMQNLKAMLIETNLTTAPGLDNERELVRYAELKA
jgi:hypothetical protein